MPDDSDLDVGDVTVRVDYSTINYKDGLAITNASPVIQRFPLSPGIALTGTFEASDSAEFAVDDKVVLNGWGLSQTSRAYVRKLPARLRPNFKRSTAHISMSAPGRL